MCQAVRDNEGRWRCGAWTGSPSRARIRAAGPSPRPLELILAAGATISGAQVPNERGLIRPVSDPGAPARCGWMRRICTAIPPAMNVEKVRRASTNSHRPNIFLRVRLAARMEWNRLLTAALRRDAGGSTASELLFCRPRTRSRSAAPRSKRTGPTFFARAHTHSLVHDLVARPSQI